MPKRMMTLGQAVEQFLSKYMLPGTHIPADRKYTFDGEPLDIPGFILENEMSPIDVEQIARLEVGEEIVYGGGAAATFVLRRIE